MGRNFPSFHICLTVLTVKLELSLFSLRLVSPV